MHRDIEMARNLGADGVVFGIPDADGNIDTHRSRRLVELARPLNVTFHRAFDMSADLFRALEDSLRRRGISHSDLGRPADGLAGTSVNY